MDGVSPPTPVQHGIGHGPRGAWFLAALCIAVAAASLTWKSWDMFGGARVPMLQGSDDTLYYVWLPAVVMDHDLDFSKQVARCATLNEPAREAWLAQGRTATGLLPNRYPPGWALGSLPFFLAARALAPAGSTGFEPIFLLAVWFGQLLYAAASLVLATAIIRRLVPQAPAAVAVLAVWLASPLAYYQTARVSLSHNQVFALAMAVFWLTLRISRGDRRRRAWLALGFCSALLVVTRNVAAVYLVFPAAVLFRDLRSWRALSSLLLGAAGPATVQLVAWKLLFGSWIVYTYGSEQFDFSHIRLVDVLFSPRHGWFYWHPLLLVGILAFLGWSLRRPWAWPWTLSLALCTVLNAAWPTWWFGSSFGNRAFDAATFFCMVGLAALLAAVRARPALRSLLVGVLVIAIGWNLLLLSLFQTRRISNQDPVTYADAARAAAGWLAGVHSPPKGTF